MDTLIEAASIAAARVPGLSVAIAGDGRDRRRIERLVSNTTVPVKLLGELTDAELPSFYACGDVFALCPRSRWAGLEQEGFGIVLVEAAACALPCVTLDSGGAGEAVVDGETGTVVRSDARATIAPARRRSKQAKGVADALASVLSDPGLAQHMGEAGRRRAEQQLSYDVLAVRLGEALERLPGSAVAGGASRRRRVKA